MFVSSVLNLIYLMQIVLLYLWQRWNNTLEYWAHLKVTRKEKCCEYNPRAGIHKTYQETLTSVFCLGML